MAGGVYNISNSSYYLHTNQNYWPGSPNNFYPRGGAYEFIVHSSVSLDSNYVDYVDGARPVISLSSSVKLSGDGTYNNVYTVS